MRAVLVCGMVWGRTFIKGLEKMAQKTFKKLVQTARNRFKNSRSYNTRMRIPGNLTINAARALAKKATLSQPWESRTEVICDCSVSPAVLRFATFEETGCRWYD